MCSRMTTQTLSNRSITSRINCVLDQIRPTNIKCTSGEKKIIIFTEKISNSLPLIGSNVTGNFSNADSKVSSATAGVTSLSAETGFRPTRRSPKPHDPNTFPELSTEFYSSCLPYTLSDPDVLLETEFDQRIHPVSTHDFPPLHPGEHLAYKAKFSEQLHSAANTRLAAG